MGETIRPNSLDAVGDYLSAVDVAHAVHALIDAPALRYRHYNIASGVTTTIGEIIGWAAEKVPGLSFEVSPDEHGECRPRSRV